MSNRVTPEQFVKAYMKWGGDKAVVANELGVSTAAVHARLKVYRKAGVKLPVSRKPNNRLDVRGLNELIKSIR